METKTRILIIDDEVPIRRFLKVALTGRNYQVEEAPTAQDGLNQVISFRPDLVVLDLGLPDMDGLEVVRKIREWSKVPIIILSVKGQEETKIAALDAGANDYVTKPFGMGELFARIRAAIRDTVSITEEPQLAFDDLKIDLAHRRVTVNEKEVKLTPIEYDLLKHLALNAGKVLTHRYLLQTIWGPAYENEPHYVRVHIAQIRQKIEEDPARPRHIITEPGIGYRMLDKV